MKKKIGLLIVSAFVLSVIFSIASQASFVQAGISQYAVDDANPSPTPFFFDPNADTGKVLLTVNCGEGGTVDPVGKHIIQRGTDVTLAFKPNEGYEIDKVTLAQGDQPATEVELTSYKYIEYNVDNSITVNVTFKPIGNMVNGLKVEYFPQESINFSAVGSRMDVTDGIVDGSSRWKPIGYRFDDSTEWTLFDQDFSGEVSAETLGLGNHNLYIIFARQIFQSSVGWTYQTPADTSSMSLASNKKGKMKLAATSNIDFALPFNQANYVVDECRFEFQVAAASTVAPTDVPTVQPTNIPVDVTPKPTPEPENKKPANKPKKQKNNGNQSPDTGDHTTIIPWLLSALVAGLGAIMFSRKTICKRR